MRAIDLYSGIGGWALGLKVAGIDVVRSYEWWKPAATTEQKNLDVEVTQTNIRELDLSDLPEGIDIVIGSPPCTQFSYANRGGSGDIADGLKDIAKFLEVVDFLKPKFWAMENVPRVAEILERELSEGGELERFTHLLPDIKIEIFNLSDFGLPQRRKRCIAGNFPISLLSSYKDKCRTVTLGEAVSGLEGNSIKDANFGVEVDHSIVTDHIKEQFFDSEEERINKEAKSFHPVYNDMSFPDPWDRPVRTVTATCTRVSRESVVVEDVGNPGCYRRLTVRERGVLQGFPLTYQFFGNSYPEKLKMIGNAIPPVFTYYIAQAMQGVTADKLILLNDLLFEHPLPQAVALETTPDQAGKRYPKNRRFWFAIPSLRFKSGTRFDLRNRFEGDQTSWIVEFYFGPSKDIRTIKLNETIFEQIRTLNWYSEIWDAHALELNKLQQTVDAMGIEELQSTWITKADGPHPFRLLDVIGDTAKTLISTFPKDRSQDASSFVKRVAREVYSEVKPVSESKLEKYGVDIFCGMLLGSWYNSQTERGVSL